MQYSPIGPYLKKVLKPMQDIPKGTERFKRYAAYIANPVNVLEELLWSFGVDKAVNERRLVEMVTIDHLAVDRYRAFEHVHHALQKQDVWARRKEMKGDFYNPRQEQEEIFTDVPEGSTLANKFPLRPAPKCGYYVSVPGGPELIAYMIVNDRKLSVRVEKNPDPITSLRTSMHGSIALSGIYI